MFLIRLLMITILGTGLYISAGESIKIETFADKQAVRLENQGIKKIIVPKFSIENGPLLPRLKTLSLINNDLQEFDLEELLKHAPCLVSLDLSGNRQLNKLIISAYNHSHLVYIGLNNVGTFDQQDAELKKLNEQLQKVKLQERDGWLKAKEKKISDLKNLTPVLGIIRSSVHSKKPLISAIEYETNSNKTACIEHPYTYTSNE